MKDLSVIIPCYNSENTIGPLINKIMLQYNNFIEYILVDDGSTDNTSNILQEYKEKYPQIQVFSQKNKGVSSARNLGLEKCKGKYVWFIDSDDDIAPYAIKEILKNINTSIDDCYVFGVECISGNTKTNYCSQKTTSYSPETGIANNFDSIFSQNLLKPLWNKVLKVSVLQDNNLRFRDMASGEDADFFLRFLLFVKSLKVVNSSIYIYKIDSISSSSKRFQPKYIHDQEKMYESLLAYTKKNDASFPYIAGNWSYETRLGYCNNIYNLIEKKTFKCFYAEYTRNIKTIDKLTNLLPQPRRLRFIKRIILSNIFSMFLVTKIKHLQ